MSVTVAGGTKIEWADFTFNPWWGCERVSPACAHCYADTFAKRVGQKGLWTKTGGHGFRFLSEANWAKPLKWARTAPAILGRRPRVFCASMADVFEDRDELVDPRARLFDLIRLTPQLDWLILTKRPEEAREELGRLYDYLEYDILEPNDPLGYLPNVWLGVSIENSRFAWRADVLREIPAAVRFISAEPLLGSLVDVERVTHGRHCLCSACKREDWTRPELAPCGMHGETCPPRYRPIRSAPLALDGIDWIIIGGESGPRARRTDPEWVRELISSCRARDVVCCQSPPAECCGRYLGTGECCAQPVPGSECCGEWEELGPGSAVFVKQLGSALGRELGCRDVKGGDIDEWPADLRIREHPRSPAE